MDRILSWKGEWEEQVVVPTRGLKGTIRRGQAREGLPLIDSIHGAPNGGCQKASVGLSCLGAAGRAQAVEAGQLVRVAAIAVDAEEGWRGLAQRKYT